MKQTIENDFEENGENVPVWLSESKGDEKQELSPKHIEAGGMTVRRIFSGENGQGLEV